MLTISARFFASKVTAAHVASVASSRKYPTGMKISPYAMYIKENFKNDPKVKNTDLMKDLSAKWKEMSMTEKTKYSDLSKNHNEKKLSDFMKLSTEEQSKMIHEAQEKKADRANRRQAKERREKRKQEGRPTPPPSAYALFIKEKLSGAGTDVKENMKVAVAQWKTLTDNQKEKYVSQAKKLMDEYHVTLEKWETEKKKTSS